ncbi:unnamed protein product [Amoebophrya sp. A120]|nr:unnamed protein product [Amoebophrya sp. A120]|eukprot:GSA120T00014496001.1
MLKQPLCLIAYRINVDADKAKSGFMGQFHGFTFPYNVFFKAEPGQGFSESWRGWLGYDDLREENAFFKQRLTLLPGDPSDPLAYLPDRFLTRAFIEGRDEEDEMPFAYVQRKSLPSASTARNVANVITQGTGLRNLATSGSIWEFVTGARSYKGQEPMADAGAFGGLQLAFQFGHLQWVKQTNFTTASGLFDTAWHFYRYTTAEDTQQREADLFLRRGVHLQYTMHIAEQGLTSLALLSSHLYRPTIVMENPSSATNRDGKKEEVARLEYTGSKSLNPFKTWFGGRKMEITIHDPAKHGPLLVTELLLRCDADNASFNFLKRVATIATGFSYGFSHFAQNAVGLSQDLVHNGPSLPDVMPADAIFHLLGHENEVTGPAKAAWGAREALRMSFIGPVLDWFGTNWFSSSSRPTASAPTTTATEPAK